MSGPINLEHHLRPGSERWPVVGFVIVALLYLLLAVAVSQTMHFSRAFDEGYHLEYVTFIKQNGHLPKSYEERAQITRADFPPLYQLLVAFASAGVTVDGPPTFKNFYDSFRYRAIDHQNETVWTLDTEDYRWPYLGRFAVWQIGRGISIGLSLLTLLIVFLTLRQTPLGQIPLASLAGAALLAFIPRYLLLGSVLNDDNLLGLLAALYFWMLVKAVNQPLAWRPFVGLGLCLGLSLTVKYTLVVAPLEILVVCGWLAWRFDLGWSWFWGRVGLTGLLTLLCASWWFGWNIWFLNTVAEDGWLAGLLRPMFAGGTDTTLNRISGFLSGGQVGLTGLPEETIVGSFPQWLRSTFYSFWGVGVIDTLPPFFPYVYGLIGLLLLGAGLGLWRLWRTSEAVNRLLTARLSTRAWLGLFVFHIALFIILPLIRFGLTRRLSVAAQGRHILIPAATAVVALLIWGIAAAWPRRRPQPAFALVVAAFAIWSGAHVVALAENRPVLLPLRTLPQAAEWLPLSSGARFGDALELVSYGSKVEPERGQLTLELAWRALKPLNESYLMQIELLDSTGTVVSHWRGYHGNGRVPTLAWDLDFAVFDRLALPLPNLSAGDYQLAVRVSGLAGPLPVNGDAAQPLLRLADISLQQPAQLAFDPPLESDRAAMLLWRADGPVEADMLPRYRYPATIGILFDISQFDQAPEVALIDPAGQTWPAEAQSRGLYSFTIGPRWPSGEYRLQLDQVARQPVLQVENWSERKFSAPDIPVPLEANFANQIRLLGYYLPQPQVRAGQAFPITLYWQAPSSRSPQADFVQFNHLLDSGGVLRGGYDRRPLEYYSTLLWAPGEVVVDGYAVPVDPDAPPGQYYLDVGFYLAMGESAVNLPLVRDGQLSEVSSVTVGPIEVVAP